MKLELNHILRPSSFYRAVACAGSITASIGIEKPATSEVAERGTRLHTYLEKLVSAHRNEGEIQSDGIPLEEVEEFNIVLNLFEQFMSPERFTGCELVKGRYRLESEQHLELPNAIITGGTADIVLTWMPPDSSEIYLEIADLKTGQIRVSAENNLQLMFYAYAKIKSMKQAPALVRLTILQVDNINETTYAAQEIIEIVEQALGQVQLNINQPNDFAEGDHCRYCPAVLKCPLKQERALEVVETVVTVPAASDLTPAQIQNLVINKKQIENYLAAVEKHAFEQYHQHPDLYPDLKLVRGVSRRVISDKDKLIADFGSEVVEVKLKTLSEIEQAIGKEALAEYTVKPLGKIQLVPASDKRQAIDIDNDITADEIF